MKKLYELLNQPKSNGLFGVEIECEGIDLARKAPGWNTESDGSLRGVFPDTCCEYVFDGPATMATTLRRIYALEKAMEDNEAILKFSFRTSVHVHVNVQDLDWNEYCAMLYTSILLESTLSRFCGEERSNNRFCLRSSDAEGFINTLLTIFKRGVDFLKYDVNPNAVRYSFVNVASTPKYGSIEYRGMRGTLDREVLVNWIKALNNIKEFSRNKSPKAIHDFFVRNHPLDFVKEVLGDVFKSFNYDGIVGDLRNAFSLTLELPYSFDPPKAEVLLKDKPIIRVNRIAIPPRPINLNDIIGAF